MKVSKKGEAVQSTLDGVLEKPKYAKPYTRKGVAHAVAQFVACDDQVRKIVVLCIEIDSLQPGLCTHRETHFSKLSCCNEAQDNAERLA